MLIKISPLLEQLKPQEEEKLSSWAEKNFYVSPDYSPDEYGLYSLDRRPFQREPLDEIGNIENKMIVAVAGIQMLKTMIMMIATANRIAKRPGPMLHIMDVKETIEKYSIERLAPMIRDNNYLGNAIEEVKPKKTNSKFIKKFYGGHLSLVGAQSSSGLIFSTIKYLNLDEVDSYPLTTLDEKGSIIKLAESRLAEVDESQIIAASSPGHDATSIIMPLFYKTDQRYYHVPCPHCDYGQKLEWGGPDYDYGIKWKDNDPTTAYYLCAQCKKEILNRSKYWMNSQGIWVKTFPEIKHKPGFRISRLYSPAAKASWPVLVEEFLNAQKLAKAGDTEDLKVFINNVLAETWTPKYNTPKEEKLLARVENYYSPDNPQIPGKICFITAFVDVMDTWLYVKVKGWGIGEESWLIEEKEIQGNPSLRMVWNELDIFLMKGYQHPLGFNLYISAIGVDTGGHHSDSVYAYVKERLVRRIPSGAIQKFYATKGWNSPWKPITDYKQHLNNKGGIPLYMVGTDTAKEVIFNRFAIDNPEKSGPGYMHVNHFATAEYFQGIFSETLIRDKITKQAKWVPIPNVRNEPLDGEVGNLFILRLSRANLLNITEDLMRAADKLKQGNLFSEPAQQQPQLPRDNWVNNWNK